MSIGVFIYSFVESIQRAVTTFMVQQLVVYGK